MPERLWCNACLLACLLLSNLSSDPVKSNRFFLCSQAKDGRIKKMGPVTIKFVLGLSLKMKI